MRSPVGDMNPVWPSGGDVYDRLSSSEESGKVGIPRRASNERPHEGSYYH